MARFFIVQPSTSAQCIAGPQLPFLQWAEAGAGRFSVNPNELQEILTLLLFYVLFPLAEKQR